MRKTIYFLAAALATSTSSVAVVASPLQAASPVEERGEGPLITAAPDPALAKRATSCTFSGSSGASLASKSQKSCSTIVLSSVAVPSGTTLDLSDLPEDTTVSSREMNPSSRSSWCYYGHVLSSNTDK